MSEIAGIRKRVGKIGLIPGELVQSGDSESNVTISVFDYDKSFFVEKKIADIAECFEFRNKPSATWINIDGNFSKEVLEQLGHCYGIHPLVLEDIMTCGQRPKFEDYGDYLFIVIKMIYPDSNNNTIDEQLSLLIGSNYVISIQEKPNGDPFNIIRERIRKDLGKIRKTGVDYLAYSIMDIVVDNYYLSLEKTGEKIESLEDEILENPSATTLQQIHELKRELISLRKIIWPLREVVNAMGRNDSKFIHTSTLPYIRDIYDHVIQLIDSVETFRDITATMLDVYLSSLSNKLNVVMKRLTMINCIFMPMTVIAGIGGMSEWSMMTGPNNWKLTYPLLVLGLVVVGFMNYKLFKWKGWT